MKLSQPQQLMAQSRDIIEEAYAGDIIGVFDPGVFSIGDTLCSPGKKIRFEGIPTFAPELFSLCLLYTSYHKIGYLARERINFLPFLHCIPPKQKE